MFLEAFNTQVDGFTRNPPQIFNTKEKPPFFIPKMEILLKKLRKTFPPSNLRRFLIQKVTPKETLKTKEMEGRMLTLDLLEIEDLLPNHQDHHS